MRFFLRDIQTGETFIEMLVAVAILVILAALAVPAFHSFQRESSLNNNTEEIISGLRLARNKTLASEEDSQWGIYFNTSTVPNQYILFKGANFSSRSTFSDKVYKLGETVEFYEINLEDLNGTELPNSPVKEIVFERLTGETNQPGEISLKSKTSSKIKIIQIKGFGQIELE